MNTPKFHRYEIVPIKDLGDEATVSPDNEADFYGLFGFIEGFTGGEMAVAIGDYPDREAAGLVLDMILGQQ